MPGAVDAQQMAHLSEPDVGRTQRRQRVRPLLDVGELPWFGIIKLKLEGNENWPDNSGRNLLIAIIVLIATPFLLDIGIHMIVKAFKPEEKNEEEGEPLTLTRGKGGPASRPKAESGRPARVRRPPPRFKP